MQAAACSAGCEAQHPLGPRSSPAQGLAPPLTSSRTTAVCPIKHACRPPGLASVPHICAWPERCQDALPKEGCGSIQRRKGKKEGHCRWRSEVPQRQRINSVAGAPEKPSAERSKERNAWTAVGDKKRRVRNWHMLANFFFRRYEFKCERGDPRCPQARASAMRPSGSGAARLAERRVPDLAAEGAPGGGAVPLAAAAQQRLQRVPVPGVALHPADHPRARRAVLLPQSAAHSAAGSAPLRAGGLRWLSASGSSGQLPWL